MLFIKLSGAALIIGAGFLGGRYFSQNLKLRCSVLESIIFAANFLKEQMVCFRYEIDTIYANLLKTGFEKELLLFLTEDKSEQNFCFLTDRDKKIAKELFLNIGMSDLKSEEERILVYIKLLSDELNSAKEDYEKKQKLYKNVGTFLGIGIAILFI